MDGDKEGCSGRAGGPPLPETVVLHRRSVAKGGQQREPGAAKHARKTKMLQKAEAGKTARGSRETAPPMAKAMKQQQVVVQSKGTIEKGKQAQRGVSSDKGQGAEKAGGQGTGAKGQHQKADVLVAMAAE